MLELGKNDPKDPRYTLAMSLINQEKLFPLKQQLETCLTDKLNERIKGRKPEEIIASAETITQIFCSICEKPDMTINELSETLSTQADSPELKAQLAQKLQEMGANGKTASELNTAQLTAIYDLLEKKNIEQAKQNLDKQINKNKKKDPETVVQEAVEASSRALNKNINKALSNKGFKNDFSTMDFGTRFDYTPNIPNTNGRQATVQPISRGGASNIILEYSKR